MDTEKSNVLLVSLSSYFCLFLLPLLALLEASSFLFSLALLHLQRSSLASLMTFSICSLAAGCPLIVLILAIDCLADCRILSVALLITFCEKTIV